MANNTEVMFVDRGTGEVLPTRADKKREAEEAQRRRGVNLAPVIILFAFIIGLFIGGGIATGFNADEVERLENKIERTQTHVPAQDKKG